MLLKLLTYFLPWYLRRRALNTWFGFEIDRDAYIGRLAWVWPQKLIMHAGCSIDHLTVAINLTKIEMAEKASIGRGNWITGFPEKQESLHFRHQPHRRAELILGASSSVTKNHHLDCTNLLHIGSFTTIAGYASQFLTHSINIAENRQDSLPIYIGDYTFIGTNVVVLGGASLPNYSVLGAKSLLNKSFTKEWTLYGGIPAAELKQLPRDTKYFFRKEGFVY
jgi:acetyltransferase-like isoleucine patch superfamily enzyme